MSIVCLSLLIGTIFSIVLSHIDKNQIIHFVLSSIAVYQIESAITTKKTPLRHPKNKR